MHWPADHPLLTDDALRPSAGAAIELSQGARLRRVLRYLPGRRVVSLLEFEHGPAVLKVFASPRARGNGRRLRLLAASRAAAIVPTSLGTDESGHVHLISYHAGVELDRSPDVEFVAGCRQAGRRLRLLHDCGARLDRSWGYEQEAAQLERQALPSTIAAVRELLADGPDTVPIDWVSAHRDCHPGQVIVQPSGDVLWVDLDDCAMAPRPLDLGNMVAHLRRENLRGARDLDVSCAAETQFLTGYQEGAPVAVVGLDRWIDLATLRLAALAAARHRDWELHDRLLASRTAVSR